MTKEDTHTRAWREDRRRLSKVDEQVDAVAKGSVAEIDVAAQGGAGDAGVVTNNAVKVTRRPFADPPRFVPAPQEIRSETPIVPAPEQRAEWKARIVDCFGVELGAARALLSRLRLHVAGQGEIGAYALNDALAIVHAYAPQSVVEAELVVSMVIASREAARQLVAGQSGGHLPTLLERTRLGQKFLSLHMQALDRLLRVRGVSTQQTIVIKRVIMNANALVLPSGNG